MQRLNATEQALIDVWEAHTAAEFEHRDADAAIATMTDHPVLIHVPVGTGATGREALRKFYREIFIPQIPPDAELQLLTRSVTQYRIIDEFILHLTHTVRMDWFAPGIALTGRRLAVPHVGIIAFEDGKISSEHIPEGRHRRGYSVWPAHRVGVHLSPTGSSSPDGGWPDRLWSWSGWALITANFNTLRQSGHRSISCAMRVTFRCMIFLLGGKGPRVPNSMGGAEASLMT